jgi:hypothetical protein
VVEITPFHQLGRFIVQFQAIETLLNEVLALIADSDQEAVYILTNELEYSKRLKTADVLFARFVGLHADGDNTARTEFHRIVVELNRLGARRNELVHSNYYEWFDIDGAHGFLRRHSRLKGEAGKREETEEELRPEIFNLDLEHLTKAENALEAIRRRVIDWLHPLSPS